jgi:hypothetical protein
MNFERIEYFCTKCHEKGTLMEILVHPTVLLLRGRCSPCGIDSAIKAVDLLQLAEHIDEPVPLESSRRAWRKADYFVSVVQTP